MVKPLKGARFSDDSAKKATTRAPQAQPTSPPVPPLSSVRGVFTSQHNTAQHNTAHTAQHNTAHSTAQHSTAQHSPTGQANQAVPPTRQSKSPFSLARSHSNTALTSPSSSLVILPGLPTSLQPTQPQASTPTPQLPALPVTPPNSTQSSASSGSLSPSTSSNSLRVTLGGVSSQSRSPVRSRIVGGAILNASGSTVPLNALAASQAHKAE